MSSRDAALFVVLDPASLVRDRRLGWEIASVVRDQHGLGYRVVPVLLLKGLPADSGVREAAVEAMLRVGVRPAALLELADASDPRPAWELARRCGLSLGHSLLLHDGSEPLQGLQVAGVRRAANVGEMLRGVYA
jgi:hypothetical protein